jgi:hypothetical protein
MDTMDDLLKEFNGEMRAGIFVEEGKYQDAYSAISQWIASHREKLILAWWAENGFAPWETVLVELRTPRETKYLLRKSTPEERDIVSRLKNKEAVESIKDISVISEEMKVLNKKLEDILKNW